MISFLIPTHNYGKYLKKCISSILKNNPKYIREIIIINDSSTDNTDNIVSSFKQKKIKYFKRSYKSLSKTMNFAIKKTRGNLLCKIDPDDEIKSNFAELQYKKFVKLKSDFLYSDFIIRKLKSKKEEIKVQKINPLFKKFQYPHGSGCLFKKKIWLEVKGYNEKIFYQDDYDFWLRIIKKNFKINYFNKALYIYNKHDANMSINFFKKNLTKLNVFLSNLF